MNGNLHAAVAELDRAREAALVAQDALVAARDLVHVHIRLAGCDAMAEGRTLDGEIVRRLYWLYPEVHVEVLGSAMGVPTSDVFKYAGSGHWSWACPDCGVQMETTLKNRTHRQRLGVGSPCQSCWAHRAEVWAERNAAWAAERRAAYPEDYPGTPEYREMLLADLRAIRRRLCDIYGEDDPVA